MKNKIITIKQFVVNVRYKKTRDERVTLKIYAILHYVGLSAMKEYPLVPLRMLSGIPHWEISYHTQAGPRSYPIVILLCL